MLWTRVMEIDGDDGGFDSGTICSAADSFELG